MHPTFPASGENPAGDKSPRERGRRKTMMNSRTKLFNAARWLGTFSAIMAALWLTTAMAAPAQTFNSLASFNGADGENPQYGFLVQGTDGNYYGTTSTGGANSYGAVFKVTPSGELSLFYSFCSEANCTDGANPYAGLVLATDGNFYGTTSSYATNNAGTIFKITPVGTLTTIYSFCAKANCTDGSTPYAGLIQGADGNLYGTTYYGGANGDGAVFKVTTKGKLTTLYSFCAKANCADGESPNAGLVQATDGNLYGTTLFGGANSEGTVFRITTTGKLTTLYDFCPEDSCADGGDGASPLAGLVQATDGNLYGTTEQGGANASGTVFKITTAGKETVLYSFCAIANCADGYYPYAGLIQGTDGNLYGTTYEGGANTSTCAGYSCGTVFKITTAGALTTLYDFCSKTDCTDGAWPEGNLLQATNGTFYGITFQGGDSSCNSPDGCGTVYSLSMGLGPFVSFLNNPGKVKAEVEILGQGFTGTTAVSFNGTAAKFSLVSANYLTATVPSGATTGTVTVTTPTGTLDSNVAFRVTPQLTSFTPTSGPVGTAVTITGVSLTQTTSVSFNGTPATYKVNSDKSVTTTVPTGATTGTITITTDGGSATSKTKFTVK